MAATRTAGAVLLWRLADYLIQGTWSAWFYRRSAVADLAIAYDISERPSKGGNLA